MTTAFHTALYRFKFPTANASEYPVVLMDLTDLSDSRQDNASIAVDPKTGRMTGNGRFLPSFGSGSYVVYFCADFHGSSIHDTGIWVNSRGSDQVQDLKVSRGINAGPLPAGAFVRFNSHKTVLTRVGLSFKSSDQACSLAESEIPSFDFESTHSAAVSAWRSKLSPIAVSTTGVNNSILKNFYSGIYRTMINPQNYTGVVPNVTADQIWFDSFYWYVHLRFQIQLCGLDANFHSLWDSFRSQIPFLTVIDTSSVTDMINGLLTIYKAQGWLPDCHMSLCKGFTV